MRNQSVVLLLLFFSIITTAVYWNHFDNDFHFDDFHTIVDNPYTKDISNIPKFFTDVRTSSSLPTHQGFRPGLTTLNTLDYTIYKWGKDLFSWKVTTPFHISIFFSYILLGLVLFNVLVHFFNKIGDDKHSKLWAAVLTGIFWVHTANAETINYIVQRADSFSTLMLMLGFFVFIKFPEKRKWCLYLIPFIAGLMVKEPTIMLTPIAFLYVFIFEQKAELKGFFGKNNLLKIAQSFKTTAVLWVLSFIFYYISQKSLPESWQASAYSTTQYLFTQPFVMLRYLIMFFLPINLSADSDWGLIPLTDERTIVGILVIAILIVWSFRQLKPEGNKAAAFGIFWFFLTLLPSSSIFPLGEVTNDHRVFLPFLGLYIALGSIGYQFLYKNHFFNNQKMTKVLGSAVLVIVFSLHAYGTIQRVEVWNDDESLWKDVTLKSPNNGRGMMNYGLALMKKSKLDEAERYFLKAVEKAPYYSLAYINLAICQNAMGKYNDIERHYQTAIQLSPQNYNGYFYYGQWLLSQNRASEAIYNLEKSLSIAHSLINARYLLMSAYKGLGENEKAFALAKETLKLFPYDEFSKSILSGEILPNSNETTSEKNENYYINEGLAKYNSGDFEQALELWLKAVEMNPENAVAWNNVGSAYIALKDWEKAIVALEKSLNLDSNFERAQNNLKFAKSNLQ